MNNIDTSVAAEAYKLKMTIKSLEKQYDSLMSCLKESFNYELHDIIDKLNTFNSLESRIKLLEDNAFSDRAKRIELENKIEELEKTLDHYKKHINEELMVALAPFKYYVNEMISLSSRINELEKEVFP